MLDLLLAAVVIVVAVPACWTLFFYAAVLVLEWRQGRKQQRCECCEKRVGPREVAQIESDLEMERRTR